MEQREPRRGRDTEMASADNARPWSGQEAGPLGLQVEVGSHQPPGWSGPERTWAEPRAERGKVGSDLQPVLVLAWLVQQGPRYSLESSASQLLSRGQLPDRWQ